jgi:AraC-like DNA-binding protein
METGTEIFGRIAGGDEEERTSAAYGYDNARRGDANRLVIQRTLAGAMQFHERGVARRVEEGFSVLFTHREPTRYEYPPEAVEPYRHRYLTLVPSGGIRPLFDAIRKDFGSVVAMPERSEGARLHDEALRRHLEGGFRDRFEESEFVYRLLIAIYRDQVRETRERDPIEYGYHLMRDQLRVPMGVKELAQRSGVTREHFVREFSRRHGVSPGVQWRTLKLERALDMLRTTELPVEEIAVACGFASSNAFCRAFRQRYGNSPGKLRAPAV